MANKNWTYDETVIAFWTYCRIPFRSSSKTNPEVVRIAKLIGRTPDALNLKIGNIGRLDPNLAAQGITGLPHVAKMEEIVWNDFVNDPEKLAIESQKILAKLEGKTIEETSGIDIKNLPDGEERIAIVKQRIGQEFFRNAVLISYNNTCCISGINAQSLVEACHICDWAENKKERTNPCNGLTLNPLFHKAYDKHLLGINPDYKIIIAEPFIACAKAEEFKNYLLSLQNQKITLPERFLPSKDLLAVHFEKFLKAQ